MLAKAEVLIREEMDIWIDLHPNASVADVTAESLNKAVLYRKPERDTIEERFELLRTPFEAPTNATVFQTEPTISNDAEFDALPSGTVFIDPDGIRRTKP